MNDPEDRDIVKGRLCGTAYPPPDGSADREAMDRFADFLRLSVNGPADGKGRVGITEETYRYAGGEDTVPTAVDDDHPIYAWLRPLRDVGR